MTKDINPSVPGHFPTVHPGCNQPSSTSQNTLHQFPEHLEQAHSLLGALWQSPRLVHQIGSLDRTTNRFSNFPVTNVDDAVLRAFAQSDAGNEAYFACAEYSTTHSRTAANTVGAFAFWLDIDCGEKKAAAGKGYPTPVVAENAVYHFCKSIGLPAPTHIVWTGSGIHVYWVLDCMIPRVLWKTHAKLLQGLTKAYGLLADDSRTADIASVLRVPGTLNYKYVPPRPVSLRHASTVFIEQEAMLGALQTAYARICFMAVRKSSRLPEPITTPKMVGRVHEAKYGAPDLLTLASALAVLDPDCDEETWTLRRIAPLAVAARDFPEHGDALRVLARKWSSGELCGIPSVAWRTPGGNGHTGEEIFDAVWRRFLTNQYDGPRTTIRTIYYDARRAGWADPKDAFAIILDAPEEAA